MMNATPLRIFIFDDDPAITRLLQLVLSDKGHDVKTFPDPTACLVYQKPECGCTQGFPCADVIISDIMMPNMNGIDFLRLQQDMGCKAAAENKALMSAKSDSSQKAAVEELGCHFIRKPFRLDEICGWVAECAERIPQDRKLATLG